LFTDYILIIAQNENYDPILEVLNTERAERVNELQSMIVSSAQNMVQYAIEIGQILEEVKSSLEHGDFIPWVMSNCEFSRYQAVRYMRLASNVARAPHLLENATSIREALEIIKEEKEPKQLPARVMSDGTRYEAPTNRYLENGEEEVIDGEYEDTVKAEREYKTEDGINFFKDGETDVVLQDAFRSIWNTFINLTKTKENKKLAGYYINAIVSGLNKLTKDVNAWVEHNPDFNDGEFRPYSEEADGKSKKHHNFETVM